MAECNGLSSNHTRNDKGRSMVNKNDVSSGHICLFIHTNPLSKC